MPLSALAPSIFGAQPEAPRPEDQRPNAAAFRAMRHGIFVHDVFRLTSWPDGRKTPALDLPTPVASFSTARLFRSNQPVAISTHRGALRLTLPSDATWDPLDTVIELKIAR